MLLAQAWLELIAKGEVTWQNARDSYNRRNLEQDNMQTFKAWLIARAKGATI